MCYLPASDCIVCLQISGRDRLDSYGMAEKLRIENVCTLSYPFQGISDAILSGLKEGGQWPG